LASDTLALAGLSIIETGHSVSAAYATKLLADLGADVVKVEDPGGQGDETRRIGPFPEDEPHLEKSGLFLYLNANKRGVTLDITKAAGRSIFDRLVRSADVVVYDYPPSVAEELELNHSKLSEFNARVISLSLTPYGETGPYRDLNAYELNTASLAGVPLSLGSADREPLYPANFFGQFQCGLVGALGIMLAVTRRSVSGIGQHIDVSEADTWATFHTGGGIVSWLFSGRRTLRRGQRSPGVGYPFTILPCKDGYFRLLAMTKREWRRALVAMGSPAWGDDPRFQDRLKMNELYADELDALLEPWLMSHTKAELFRICYEHGVPFAPINNVHDVVDGPRMTADEFFIDIDHPEAGTFKYPRPPFTFSQTPWQIRRPAPLLGQHNDEVFGSLPGYSDERDGLATAGII